MSTVHKVECSLCKSFHPETLINDTVCVYCSADAAAQTAQNLDQPKEEKPAPEIDAQKEAQKELARRILSVIVY